MNDALLQHCHLAWDSSVPAEQQMNSQMILSQLNQNPDVIPSIVSVFPMISINEAKTFLISILTDFLLHNFDSMPMYHEIIYNFVMNIQEPQYAAFDVKTKLVFAKLQAHFVVIAFPNVYNDIFQKLMTIPIEQQVPFYGQYFYLIAKPIPKTFDTNITLKKYLTANILPSIIPLLIQSAQQLDSNAFDALKELSTWYDLSWFQNSDFYGFLSSSFTSPIQTHAIDLCVNVLRRYSPIDFQQILSTLNFIECVLHILTVSGPLPCVLNALAVLGPLCSQPGDPIFQACAHVFAHNDEATLSILPYFNYLVLHHPESAEMIVQPCIQRLIDVFGSDISLEHPPILTALQDTIMICSVVNSAIVDVIYGSFANAEGPALIALFFIFDRLATALQASRFVREIYETYKDMIFSLGPAQPHTFYLLYHFLHLPLSPIRNEQLVIPMSLTTMAEFLVLQALQPVGQAAFSALLKEFVVALGRHPNITIDPNVVIALLQPQNEELAYVAGYLATQNIAQEQRQEVLAACIQFMQANLSPETQPVCLSFLTGVRSNLSPLANEIQCFFQLTDDNMHVLALSITASGRISFQTFLSRINNLPASLEPIACATLAAYSYVRSNKPETADPAWQTGFATFLLSTVPEVLRQPGDYQHQVQLIDFASKFMSVANGPPEIAAQVPGFILYLLDNYPECFEAYHGITNGLRLCVSKFPDILPQVIVSSFNFLMLPEFDPYSYASWRYCCNLVCAMHRQLRAAIPGTVDELIAQTLKQRFCATDQHVARYFEITNTDTTKKIDVVMWAALFSELKYTILQQTWL